jgi:hypothetical protein
LFQQKVKVSEIIELLPIISNWMLACVLKRITELTDGVNVIINI